MLTRYVHHDPNAVENPGEWLKRYKELVAENALQHEALALVEDYLADRADADGDSTGFIPNAEMRLQTGIRAILERWYK